MSKQTDLINIPDAITVSGSNVGIGTSSGANLLNIHQSSASSNSYLHITHVDGGSAATDGLSIGLESDGVNAVIRNRENGYLRMYTNNAERMRIDSSGNVGIGTSSPSAPLHVKSSTGNAISLLEHAAPTVGTGQVSRFVSSTSNITDVIDSNGYYRIGSSTNPTTGAGFSERMRIDSSGNVLVGTTVDVFNSSSNSGIVAYPQGSITAARSSAPSAYFNRQTTDGTIVDLRKNGTTVGSIGVNTSDLNIHSTDAGHVGLSFGNTRLQPTDNTGAVTDGISNLGHSNSRFKDLYLSGGVYLGGTGVANKLDDYEEGTWTPTVLQGASGLSYEASNCCYTKIGRMVTLQFEIWNLTSPNGNPFNLGGLPFNSDQEGAGSVMYNNVDIPASRTQIVVYASSSNFLRFYALGDNTTWQTLIGNNMGTSFNMIGQITYMTA